MKTIAAIFLLCASVLAQGGGQVIVGNFGIQYVASAPSGSCSSNSPFTVVIGTGVTYTCQNGTWALSGGGAATSLSGVETTAPSGIPGSDLMWPDSTNHRWTMNNNNTGPFMVPGVSAAQLAGSCVQYAANGVDLVSTGAACVSSIGAVYAKAFGVKADGRIVLDATTTSGTKTITCPNNDCNFVAGDVGKIVWVQSTRTSGADVLVQDTIATVNSAQSITVTTNNASSSHTANAVLKWGTDDGAALDTAYQATGPANCSALLLPSGFIFTGRPEFNYAVTGCPLSDTFQVPLVEGVGSTATVIIPTPNFNIAAGHGCSGGGVNACFFGVQYEIFFYMKIDGGGNTITSPGTINLVQNNSALSFDFVVSNWCSACSTVTGFSTVGPESENLFGGSVAAGGNACSAAGIGEVYDNYFCSQVTSSSTAPAMSVTGSNNTLLSRGNSFQGAIIVGAGATMSAYDDYDAGTGASWQVAGTANLFSFHKVATTPPILSTASTAKINIFNTSLPSSTHATYPGLSYLGWSGSTLTDQGGNTFSGAVGPNYPGPIQSTTANVSSGTSVSKAWPVAPAAHSIQIVACFDFPSTSTINAPTDTRSLTWTQIGTNLTTTTTFGSAMNTAVYYAIDAAGGADTVTCNFSAAVTTGVIDLVELDGAAISSPLDGSTTSTGSGTSVTSSAQNTTQNGDYSFLMTFRNTAATFSAGSCTPTACFTNSGNAFMGSIYHYVPVAGSHTMLGTWSASSDWTAFWFNFKGYGMPTISGNAFALNCAAVGSAANPSVANCGSASTGAFSCATNASTTTCVVNTASVTANSEIFVQQVVDEGTRLGVTCNTGSVLPAGPLLLSKTAGVGFTLTMGTITTNPGCFNYQVVN